MHYICFFKKLPEAFRIQGHGHCTYIPNFTKNNFSYQCDIANEYNMKASWQVDLAGLCAGV